jgi:hypothetical protein
LVLTEILMIIIRNKKYELDDIKKGSKWLSKEKKLFITWKLFVGNEEI